MNNPHPPAAPARSHTSVDFSRALEKARQDFLKSLNKRTPLLNTNRKRITSTRLNIEDGDCDVIFATLYDKNNARLPFKAMLQSDDVDDLPESVDDKEKRGERVKPVFASDDSALYVRIEPERLAMRLHKMESEVKSLEEEQGLNVLFLAMGFLRWREDKTSQIDYEAPLILLPVDLVSSRKQRTNKQQKSGINPNQEMPEPDSYYLKFREDELITNLALREHLRQNFNITLPEITEEREDNWLPSLYFKKVEQAISTWKNWSIDKTGLHLGFFSYAKIQMYRDLDIKAWPENWFENHSLINKILAPDNQKEECDNHESEYEGSAALDRLYTVGDLIQILDADASQTIVIEEARKGKDLVVQGPPGTGKSQTIANILAAAVHDGKTVLFVSEKMAALSVVHERLVKCGLEDICLELHSHKSNKKLVIQEFNKTLQNNERQRKMRSCTGELQQARDCLNHCDALLHAPLNEEGDTPHGALSEIIYYRGSGTTAPSIPLDGLEKEGPTARKKISRLLSDLIEALQQTGSPESHPFRGVRQFDLQPMELERLKDKLDIAIKAIDDLWQSRNLGTPELPQHISFAKFENFITLINKASADISQHIHLLFTLTDEDYLPQALETGTSWQEAYTEASNVFSDDAFTMETGSIKQAIVAGNSSFFRRLLSGHYRQACAMLKSLIKQETPSPKTPASYLALINQLIDVQQKHKKFSDEKAWLQEKLQSLWHGEKTDFIKIKQLYSWVELIKKNGILQTSQQVQRLLSSIKDPAKIAQIMQEHLSNAREKIKEIFEILQLDPNIFEEGKEWIEVDLQHIRSIMTRMQDIQRYNEWRQLQKSIQHVENSPARFVVDPILSGKLPEKKGIDEFLYACAESRWIKALRMHPELNQIQELRRHEWVREFKKREHQRFEEVRKNILFQHYQNLPKGYTNEIGIIRKEISKKKGHKSIRRIMREAGTAAQKIRPIFLMSPLSVAQYIEPGTITFDLLVMDEASQIRPEEALGCILRARQLVVVGDMKQLPPTSFFDKIISDEIEDDEDEETTVSVNEMESILSLCSAGSFEQKMLKWHYRSRDPSLIQISNAEFYESKLTLPVPPWQKSDDYGLKFRRVDGLYSPKEEGRGRANTNRIEAEAIVKVVCEHARQHADLSLGIVAFSKAQADMINEILERELRQDADLNDFYQKKEQQFERLFVKNIENVQGDERDVILISVCYGPHDAGGRLMRQNFGPINKEGGERRLNVLFSRARVRCEVFASFDPSDINPNSAKNNGPKILRRFLEFAKEDITKEIKPTGDEADSPFEEDVARTIKKLGYDIHHQVGTSGFKIDIGVLHPDQPWNYILAVECDGATYHSAVSARERDRMRQEILENQGWRFHRIWSTDWFYRRDQTIEDLKAALEKAYSRI